MFDPRFQAIDATGKPYSGAQLFFYRGGTTSLIPIYKNSDATTPHANPVVANTSGAFPAIFIASANPFKIILKSDAGVTLDTIDRIPVGEVIDLETLGQIVDQTSDEADRAEAAAGAAAGSAAEAAGYAAGLNIPPIAPGDAGKVLRVKSDEQGSEWDDPPSGAGGSIPSRAWAIANLHPAVAPDSLRTDGYTSAGDGGGALYKKVASEPSHAGKLSITLADGVTVVWYVIVGLTFRPAMFGVVADWDGSAGTDNAAALQAMADAIPDGATVDYGADQVRFASNVTFSKDVKFVGNGALLYGDGTAYISVAGSLTSIGRVNAAAAKSAKAVTLDTVTGLAANDIIIIHNQVDYSFAPYRPEYHDGEFNEVKGISGSVVTLKNRTRSAYVSAATNKVFRVNAVRFSARGVKFHSPAGVFALRITQGVDLSIDAEVKGGTAHALSLHQCYCINIVGGRYEHTAPAAGNNYGIAFSNCQLGYVAPGVYAYGTRHAIMTGGATGDGCVPCRDITVDGVHLANGENDIHCADAHGNTENCGFINCEIDGTVGLGGISPFARRCRAVARGSVRPYTWNELVGGQFDISGSEASFASTSSATAAVGPSAASLSGQILQDYELIANNLMVNCTAFTTVIMVGYHNAWGNVDWAVSMNDIVLHGVTGALANILDLVVANDLAHGVAPIAAKTVSQNGVTCIDTLAEAAFVPARTGAWTATRWNLTPFRGSNANGEYSKEADGTMKCWGRRSGSVAVTTAFGSFFATAAAEVQSFPVSFLGNAPSFRASQDVGWIVSETCDITGGSYYYAHAVSSTTTRILMWEAVGRWLP